MAFFLVSLFSLFLFLSSSATACDRCLHQSKASFFSKASSLSAGACDYAELALSLSAGNLAAAVPSIFKDGASCGACFQIRCKDPKVCSKSGTRVVVTDLNRDNKTDFVLSSRAFQSLAVKGKAQYLLKLGILDIEYKRYNANQFNQKI
ncbi:Expansin-like A3 [Stylosanthes scabra]|uniref:Expansin-like A3 n=1 Tax=Stylosanthes scabra TaxID=79078 RepID=A0ABU6VQ67_9FABA|nr:Expansin-like A3 [Stylosanthes scabra]